MTDGDAADDWAAGSEPLDSEEQPDAGGDHEPWDPDSIRVSTKSFSLRNILDMIDEGSIELAPEFQRHRVWSEKQKSLLIESVLLQIPLPAFYFAEDREGAMRVVDGLQRLSTVHDFARGSRFALSDLEYLRDQYDGKRFDDLEPSLQRRLHNTQIVAHVITPTTPPAVMYNIFSRINTLGSPLKAQEIRHSMSKQRSRGFLQRCADTEEFAHATRGSLRNHSRMGDREVILRFCAFRHFDLSRYKHEGSMDLFLLEATRAFDDPQVVADHDLETLFRDFRTAMRNADIVFGAHAFRKWEKNKTGRNPINRSLFEAWSVALADYTTEDVRARAEAIRAAAQDLMANDVDYREAITTSTGDPRKVEYRHLRTAEAARAS